MLRMPHLQSLRSFRRTPWVLIPPSLYGGVLRRFQQLLENGGEGGIRTPGGVTPTTDFESVPFDHSGTSPTLKDSGSKGSLRGLQGLSCEITDSLKNENAPPLYGWGVSIVNHSIIAY